MPAVPVRSTWAGSAQARGASDGCRSNHGLYAAACLLAESLGRNDWNPSCAPRRTWRLTFVGATHVGWKNVKGILSRHRRHRATAGFWGFPVDSVPPR